MRVFLLTASALVLTTCSAPSGRINDAQYWQRISASDATYVRGPKAQQILHRDVSHCVVELRELERMGVIKDAIPADNSGRIKDPNPYEREMAAYETPERDGALFVEPTEYHDFEGCMYAKGWERVAHLPFDLAYKSRDEYLENMKAYRYQSTYGKKQPSGNSGNTRTTGRGEPQSYELNN